MKTSEIEVTFLDHCGSDLSVVNAARVSFEKESDWVENEDMVCPSCGRDFLDHDDPPEGVCRGCGEDVSDIQFNSHVLSQKDQKLIKYLAKHKHTSPFNHCFASFRVKAPIFVARQLVKHKFLPWNEVSRRYVDSEPEFYIPDVWRERADNVKQGSAETEVKEPWKSAAWAKNAAETALFAYNAMLKEGVCPEQARMVLPQNTMTEWIWSGTLGAWADMCRLRLDAHAQKETRDVAEEISFEMDMLFPVSWPALLEN